MARMTTVVEAVIESPEPLTVGDLRWGTFFQIEMDDLWRLRTDSVDHPSVILGDVPGWLSTELFLRQRVTRVLAPGESLTIGPDV